MSQNKKNNTLAIVMYAFAIIIMIINIIGSRAPDATIIENTVQYPLIGKIDEIFFTHGTYLDGTYLSLSGEKKRTLYKLSIKKILYRPRKTDIIYIVQEGDSIFKMKNNDTFSIYRGDSLIYKAVLRSIGKK